MSSSSSQSNTLQSFHIPHETIYWCVVCESPASFACSICKSTHYCSAVHQKEDWQRHKYEHVLPEDQKSVIVTAAYHCRAKYPLIRVKHTGDPIRKFGVFARQDIPAGTILLNEKTYATGRMSLLVTAFEKGQFRPVEKEFWSLDRDFTLEKNSEGIHDVMKRNSLAGSDLLKEEDPIAALFFIFHRFNHSCGPNAGFYYNGSTREMTVCAARDLKKGEEITVYYHPMYFLNKETRDVFFTKRFQTDCKCHVCADEDENLMDTVAENVIENVFDIMENKTAFHTFLDTQEVFDSEILERIYNNMFHLLDLLNGFEKGEVTPFSPFRVCVYKYFLLYLQTYPKFIRGKRHDRTFRSFFQKVKKDSIAYFKAYNDDSMVNLLEKIKIFP